MDAGSDAGSIALTGLQKSGFRITKRVNQRCENNVFVLKNKKKRSIIRVWIRIPCLYKNPDPLTLVKDCGVGEGPVGWAAHIFFPRRRKAQYFLKCQWIGTYWYASRVSMDATHMCWQMVRANLPLVPLRNSYATETLCCPLGMKILAREEETCLVIFPNN